MTEGEFQAAASRANRYQELHKLADQVMRAIAQVLSELPLDQEGREKASPFTGNIRESRDITGMTINFSRTRGGSGERTLFIHNMNIPACEVGKFLEELLRDKLARIYREIKEL